MEPSIEITEGAVEEAPKKSGPVTIRLNDPITLGSEVLDELVLRPTAKAFKGFSLPLTSDGSVMFQPYELAAIAVRMAGRPHPVATDRLSVGDMNRVARAVLGFLG